MSQNQESIKMFISHIMIFSWRIGRAPKQIQIYIGFELTICCTLSVLATFLCNPKDQNMFYDGGISSNSKGI